MQFRCRCRRSEVTFLGRDEDGKFPVNMGMESGMYVPSQYVPFLYVLCPGTIPNKSKKKKTFRDLPERRALLWLCCCKASKATNRALTRIRACLDHLVDRPPATPPNATRNECRGLHWGGMSCPHNTTHYALCPTHYTLCTMHYTLYTIH
jgi:hypothetical protein